MLSWLILKNYLLSRRSGALVRIIAWHCILGMGLGVAALIIVLSVMNGFNQTIRNRMLSVEPHLVVTLEHVPSGEDFVRVTAALKKSGDEYDRVRRFES